MCVACVLHLCCTCVAFVLHVMGQGLIKKHEADMLPQEEALAELLRGMLVRVLLQVCCKCVASVLQVCCMLVRVLPPAAVSAPPSEYTSLYRGAGALAPGRISWHLSPASASMLTPGRVCTRLRVYTRLCAS
jgi:ABC-type amino acid transport system permease subunit